MQLFFKKNILLKIKHLDIKNQLILDKKLRFLQCKLKIANIKSPNLSILVLHAMKQKVGIVGSGIAGLATAVHLSRKGYQVVVFEQGPTFGGKLGAATRGSYRFDLGPSLFTMPNLLTSLLDEDLKATFEVTPLHTLCHYFYEHKTTPFKAPATPKDFIQEASAYFEEHPERISRFLKKSKRVYDITAPVFLENSLHRLKTYVSKSGLKGILNLWRINMFQTMNESLEHQFKNPDFIQFFNRYATYNGSDPYQAPATLNVISHLELHYGAYLPNQGMRAIAEILFQQAQRLGVTFLFNTGISHAEKHQGNITQLVDNQGHYHPIDLCVANVDVKVMYQHILKKDIPKKIRNAENSSSALIFYFGVKRSFPELDVHNILFSKNYKAEFEAIFRTHTLQDDPTVYINITSKIIKSDAPEGCENWFVMINAAHDKGQYTDSFLSEARKKIIQKINSILKIDLESLIEEEDVLSPVTIASRTGSDKGSLYGISSNNRMSAFFRQSNHSSDFKNLYFCGGSVHPGGGIPLCLHSAQILNKIIPDAYR